MRCALRKPNQRAPNGARNHAGRRPVTAAMVSCVLRNSVSMNAGERKQKSGWE
jgi:hypothetical protein